MEGRGVIVGGGLGGLCRKCKSKRLGKEMQGRRIRRERRRNIGRVVRGGCRIRHHVENPSRDLGVAFHWKTNAPSYFQT